jgi:uncharacterized damage-inducible protein DinB
VIPAGTLAALHTRLFLNCLEGMAETEARHRIDGRSNSAAFVAAHLVESRAWTARALGLELPAPFGGKLAYGTSLDDLADLPPLEAIRAEWDAISALLEARIAALTAADLAAPATGRFPVDDATLAGTLAFLLHHEAYHIGQLSLLRRVVGLPAMSYRPPGDSTCPPADS